MEKQKEEMWTADRRRRFQSLGSLVTGTVLVGVIAWAYVAQGPEGNNVDLAAGTDKEMSQSADNRERYRQLGDAVGTNLDPPACIRGVVDRG